MPRNRTLRVLNFSTNEKVPHNAKYICFYRIYDWFYRTYGETSKETLLELMKNAVGIQGLKQLSQPELAEFYCAGLAYSAIGPDRIL